MTGHRLGTDRKRAVLVAGCPEGCQQFELETEGREESVDELLEAAIDAFGECSECGGQIGYLKNEQPSKVLE